MSILRNLMNVVIAALSVASLLWILRTRFTPPWWAQWVALAGAGAGVGLYLNAGHLWVFGPAVATLATLLFALMELLQISVHYLRQQAFARNFTR